MKLRPDLVLVKLAPIPRAPNGIILAPSLTPVPCLGKAVQVGTAVSDVQVGDVVIVPPSAGDPIDEGYFTTPHLLVRESDIAAVLERQE